MENSLVIIWKQKALTIRNPNIDRENKDLTHTRQKDLTLEVDIWYIRKQKQIKENDLLNRNHELLPMNNIYK